MEDYCRNCSDKFVCDGDKMPGDCCLDGFQEPWTSLNEEDDDTFDVYHLPICEE